MFCTNCGNRTDENAYVCVNCGVILKGRSEHHVHTNKKNNAAVLGIISMIIGILALLLSMLSFFYDISPVGMYTEIYERVFYALGHLLFSILISSLSLILSLVSKKDNFSRCGLYLSIISFFFIITEFVVVIIY